jgi:hypothetical protein
MCNQTRRLTGDGLRVVAAERMPWLCVTTHGDWAGHLPWSRSQSAANGVPDATDGL